MYNYCTLFNSLYLSRGLALYRSLEKCVRNFHLYIFAFDDECYNILKRMELSHATIISLSDFEDEQLLAVKPTRTVGEYCWTCTPSIILYSIRNYDLSNCTYLDADLFFYADPAVLIEEAKGASVIITPHRYSAMYEDSESGGTYCVQFVYFKNSPEGIAVLEWWRAACIEWCYNRREPGRFGDQKYLDVWTSKFTGIHVLEHLGGGVAPWNVQQYEFEHKIGQVWGRELSSQQLFPVIFYHFHGLKYAEKNSFTLSNYYTLNDNDIEFLYKPYIKMLTCADREIKALSRKIVSHEINEIPRIRTSLRRMFKLYALGKFREYYHKSYFLR
ncbi:glycosyl transferase [Sphingobacterium sp. DR205]|uniref:Glycosyl transferase n=2 Tax=Sphingobacteriaceae TaxID=84566 RepID=A0A363NSR8_9SPHI|nr:glycosyl transferase [Sphingobacterium athyrii]QIH36269.1 glycosyl transferase [Sphingobacterium sp. DR205]